MKALLLSAFLLAAAAHGKPYQPHYDFAKYSSGPVYKGHHHAPIVPRRWNVVRSHIKNARYDKIGFGSYYIPAIWGCGVSCQWGVMIDARTGKTYDLPMDTEYPLHGCYRRDGQEEAEIFYYRPNSRLFVSANCHYSEIEGRDDQIVQYKTTNVYEWLEARKRFVLRRHSVEKTIVPSEVR